jgi:hypothetical protein
MPVTVRFEEPSTFVLCGSGKITLAEYQRAIAEIMVDPRPMSHLLIDGREALSVPPTAEVKEGAAMLPRLLSKGLAGTAVVANRPAIYGVARMFAVFASLFNVKVRAFREMDEAQAWLETEEAQLTA